MKEPVEMKKLKYILIALAVIVLGVGGYIVYELKFKTYDTADAEVDALLEETFELQLPDGTVILVDKEGNVVDSKAGNSENSNSSETAEDTNSNTDTNVDGETEAGATTTTTETPTNAATDNSNPTNSPNTTTTEKVTVATIKDGYANTFAMIENQARARLNSLISQAAGEYSAKKKKGESISYGYFYNKYMGAATSVESSTDATVNAVIRLVEKDLQANGFDKSYAQSFAEEYKVTKKALRDELMSKALSFR